MTENDEPRKVTPATRGEPAGGVDLTAARDTALDAILADTSHNQVVVAGAGTGKTFTFRRIVETTDGRCLVMTFLNLLVDDITETLGETADVYSFHGFARKLLHSTNVPGVTKGVHYYPPAVLIYEQDLGITGPAVNRADIDAALLNLDHSDDTIARLLVSGDYYNAVSYNDAVYRIHRALEADQSAVPKYARVLVDEYQDFSLLETRLIASLANANRNLVVGDDDQALYGWRHASADYIRQLVTGGAYQRFELPYCTRCTTVLVEASHRVVGEAQKLGLLAQRVPKQYQCYTPTKGADSIRYPKITHACCSVDRKGVAYIARYIERRINDVDADETRESMKEGFPTVLIIGPSQFTDRVHDYLVAEGHANVRRKERSTLEVSALRGYQYLMRDERSRLGWRILLYCHEPSGWRAIVGKALIEGEELVDLLPADYRDRQLAIVSALRRLRAGEQLSDEEVADVEEGTSRSIADVRYELGLPDPEASEEGEEHIELDSEESDNQPTILITTLMGSKGLQAQHVFVVGLNEGHFPYKNEAPTDEEVCKLIVALTRARKSCTVVSCVNFAGTKLKRSVFLDWLRPLLDYIYVDKAFLDA